MLAASLRHRITIQQRSESQDSFGQQVVTWNDLLTNIPAAVQPLYGYEKVSGAQEAAEQHQVSIRYNPLLANPVEVAAMRVLFGSRVLEITGSVNTDERNREITLTCLEGLTQG